jgi:hypothetical protein
MICHHYKCIFVHIPKNAGQSIEHVFVNLLGLNWETRAPLLLRPNDQPELGPPRLAHMKADEYVRFNYLPQEMFDDYFKFTFVRNPWSRLVSIYKFMGYDKKIDFRLFLLGMFKKYIFERHNWFVGPQSDFVYSKEGELLVDYIGRFEDLQNGFDFVCNQIGIPKTKLPHVNESESNNFMPDLTDDQRDMGLDEITGTRTSPDYQNYQEYYDKDTIDCVAQLYRKDIMLFGYEFV